MRATWISSYTQGEQGNAPSRSDIDVMSETGLSTVQAAWSAYQAAEADRLRRARVKHLQVLIDHLLASPDTERHAWALDIAQSSVDGREATPVRLPLFRAILFPELHAGMLGSEPGCARWLAGLAPLLYRSPECREMLPRSWQTEDGLLREALRQDPSDDVSRLRLIKNIAQQLEYSLHELPTGVLYGHDGASIAQCRELQAD
ncbi:MAG: hypothetical protein KDI37_07490, partial [Xanthomonadales bacterium]|nr:hypothetical protein [Xanthomonadales bacterium]